MEHGDVLELRSLPGADHLGGLDVFDDGFSLSAGLVRGRGTSGAFRTQSLRLLFELHRDVFARHRAGGDPWRFVSPGLVSALCEPLRVARRRRALRATTRLRSILRLVSFDHAFDLVLVRPAIPGDRLASLLIASEI